MMLYIQIDMVAVSGVARQMNKSGQAIRADTKNIRD